MLQTVRMCVKYTETVVFVQMFTSAHIRAAFQTKTPHTHQIHHVFLESFAQDYIYVTNGERMRLIHQECSSCPVIHRFTHKGRISYKNTVFTQIHHASWFPLFKLEYMVWTARTCILFTKNTICTMLFSKARIRAAFHSKTLYSHQLHHISMYFISKYEIYVTTREDVPALDQKWSLRTVLHKGTHWGPIWYINTIFKTNEPCFV